MLTRLTGLELGLTPNPYVTLTLTLTLTLKLTPTLTPNLTLILPGDAERPHRAEAGCEYRRGVKGPSTYCNNPDP